jgi:hypothetical protein
MFSRRFVAYLVIYRRASGLLTTPSASFMPSSAKSPATASSQQQAQQVTRRGHGSVGLYNQRATCYLSSLLQLLFHTTYFRSAVYRMTTDGDDMRSICKALQLQFFQMQERDAAFTTKILTRVASSPRGFPGARGARLGDAPPTVDGAADRPLAFSELSFCARAAATPREDRAERDASAAGPFGAGISAYCKCEHTSARPWRNLYGVITHRCRAARSLPARE